MGPTETFKDLLDLARASGDVVFGTIGIHDRQRSWVDLALHMVNALSEQFGRLHHDTSITNIEAVTIQIKKVLQQLTVAEIVATQLRFWHMLQHACHQADDGKTTNTSQKDFVEPAHGQKLLDDDDQNGHLRIALLPLLECGDCTETRIILKRDIDFDAGGSVDKFEDRDPSLRDDNDFTILVNDAPSLDHLGKLVHFGIGSAENGLTATHVGPRDGNQVHVCSW